MKLPKTTTNVKGDNYKVRYLHIECPGCKKKARKIKKLEKLLKSSISTYYDWKNLNFRRIQDQINKSIEREKPNLSNLIYRVVEWVFIDQKKLPSIMDTCGILKEKKKRKKKK